MPTKCKRTDHFSRILRFTGMDLHATSAPPASPLSESAAHSDLERKTERTLQQLRHDATERLERGKTYIRQNPRKAALSSAALGFFLAQLPILAVTLGLGRLLFLIARPALILLGISKLVDEVRGS